MQRENVYLMVEMEDYEDWSTTWICYPKTIRCYVDASEAIDRLIQEKNVNNVVVELKCDGTAAMTETSTVAATKPNAWKGCSGWFLEKEDDDVRAVHTDDLGFRFST